MRIGAIALVLLAVAGCGSRPRSPESVARAWSAALNRNDNRAAAKLFAPGAQIVQGGFLTLKTQADAVHWNAALPCGGRIASVQAQGPNQVLVIFELTARPRHQCDGPGDAAAALFTVAHGKIVLWHETTVPTATAI